MTTPTGLTPLQVQEITKAFAICDTDGNGEIDSSELAVVMAHMLGVQPGPSEVESLLQAVDKDNSGTVSLDEFLEAVAEWLSDSGEGVAIKRFKTSSANDERKEVHHQIKGFFNQFKKAQNYEEVRQKIADSSELENGPSQGWFGFRDSLSPQQKLEFLVQYHETVVDLPAIITSIKVQSIERVNALTALSRLLSVVKVFAKPSERSAVADDLAQLFETLVRSNICEILSNILGSTSDTFLASTILECLSLFVPGPRVPSTPTSSLMHPSHMFFKRMAIQCNVPILAANFLDLNQPQACEQALAFTVSMVSFDPDVRDYYLSNGILSVLCPMVLNSTPVNLLSLLSQAISACCGVTHPRNNLPSWDLIQPSFSSMGNLLFVEDEKCLNSILGAFGLVLPGIRPDYNIITQILELTANASPLVAQKALQVATQVCRFDAVQTTAFLNRGVLEALRQALSSSESVVRNGALDLLDVLTTVRYQFQGIISSGILDVLRNLFNHDDHLRTKVAQVFRSVTQSSEISQHMARNGFIVHLCNALLRFKEFDKVLYDAYSVDGPIFNFEFVSDVVGALENIVMVGETDRIDTVNVFNPYAIMFDADAISKLKHVYNTLKEAESMGVNQWKKVAMGESTLPIRLRSLVTRIKEAHMGTFASFGRDAATTAATELLAELSSVSNDVIMDDGSGNGNANEVEMNEGGTNGMETREITKRLVKCYMPNDIRVFEVNSDITFDDLMNQLTIRYGSRSISVSFTDAEGDKVSLDGASMPAVFATASTLPVKLYLSSPHHDSNNNDGIGQTYPEAPKSPPSEDDGSNEVVMTSASKKRHRSGVTVQLTDTTSSTTGRGFGNNVSFKSDNSTDFNIDDAADQMKNDFAKMKLVQRNQNFALLQQGSSFGENELGKLYEEWSKGTNDGLIGREQFEEGMNMLGIKDSLVIEQNFIAFDQDKDNKIDYREFVVSLSTILKGSNEERIHFMFRSYDMDNSGNLTPDEVFNIFRASMAINGTLMSDKELMNTVVRVFGEIDLDGDGTINYDEFKAAVESGKLPVALAFAEIS